MDSSGNQWETVTFDKRGPGGRVSGQSQKQTLMKAQRAGAVSAQAKFGAGGNKSGTTGANRSAAKMDAETETFKHDKVDKGFSKALQQARLAKKMNQKQLATAINEKPQVINQYESGKAIPNGAVVQKLSRALGVRLPSATGKKKGGGAKKK